MRMFFRTIKGLKFLVFMLYSCRSFFYVMVSENISVGTEKLMEIYFNLLETTFIEIINYICICFSEKLHQFFIKISFFLEILIFA